MKRLLLVFLILVLAGIFGCDSLFTGPVTPLQVKLYVNGQLWTGGDKVESRPDYSEGEIMVTIEAMGGDPNAKYRCEYMDGTVARENWFQSDEPPSATSIKVNVDQTVTIRSGQAVPVSYEFTIINNAPVVLSPWLSSVKPEMGAHLRVIAEYSQWGTCPTIEDPTFTGVYDADYEYGDTLTYRLRITGPKKGSLEDFIQYRLYNDLPGANEYEILTDQWLPIETQTHFFVGYDGVAPGIGALGCYPDPDEPFNQDNPWPSGKNLCIEIWAKDSMGETTYGKFYWEIWVGGCP